MIVVGFNSETNYHFSGKLDIETDVDSPQRIHELLKKTAGSDMKGDGFSKIVCFDEDGNECDSYELSVDFDWDDEELEDELDDLEDNPDNLHEEDEDADDDD
jgi:hypothetical protein